MSLRMLFLDMDPGVDDAIAIIFASASRKFSVLGISTVAGNAPIEDTTENARRLVDFLRMETTVFKGASKPLVRPHEIAYWLPGEKRVVPARETQRPDGGVPFHGEKGLGDTRLPRSRSSLRKVSGPEAIVQAARKDPEAVTLVATGPLTNVAIALLLEPKLPTLLSKLVVMGGAYGKTRFGTGNITENAEFNVYCDPEAAKIVFEGFAGAVCVGLDVTADPQNMLYERDVGRFRNGRKASLARSLIGYDLRTYGRFEAHDPLALYYAYDSSAFRTVRARVEVGTTGALRGHTNAKARTAKNGQLIATKVDFERFRKDLFAEINVPQKD
ncbi:MAG: nucleoside hydrolase [Thaumarchaeota archaeon]|nr:nucleoside hydrolase [Nitrososphaerota archaeon]